jgi:beta-glucanase (GH16 family)
LSAGTFADDFHVFRLDWEQRAIRWYVDDRLYQTRTNWHTRGASFPAPFDQRFHLILNLAVGGNWPGNPDTTTVFPQAMVVDYVRIYRKKQGQSGVRIP